MGLAKYFGEQSGDLHPGELTWPGTMDGIPILGGSPANLKDEEYEDIEQIRVFKCSMFEMHDPDQAKKYADIMDRVANGWYVLYHRQVDPDPTHNHVKIWLEWYQVYGTIGKNGNDPSGPPTMQRPRQ